MSRSFKKNPIIKDSGKGKKNQKNNANNAIRQKLKNPDYVIADGNSYKKETESWDIADFVSRYTEEDARKDYENYCNPEYSGNNCFGKEYAEESVRRFKEQYPTVEKFLNDYWRKIYKGK